MRYDNAAATKFGKPLPWPEIESKTDESPLGWTIPQWLAAELVYVARNWHIPPREWLATPNRIRKGMFKHLRLSGQAEDGYRGGADPGSDPYAGFFPNEQNDDS